MQQDELTEIVAAVLTALGVWLIGDMDVRGQWCMAGAQASWAVFAVVLRRRWMLLLNLGLLALTARAIVMWSQRTV